MRKLIAILLLSAGLGFACGNSSVEEVSIEEPTTTEVAPTEETSELTDWVKDYFNADKVAMYMSWVAYIGTIIGLVANINKLKKANNLTLQNVSDNVKKQLEDTVGKEVKDQVERFLPALVSTQEKTNELLKMFTKIQALAQENTPESRVAILELIEQMGAIGKDITDNAKDLIKEEVRVIQEKRVEVENKLDEIIDKYDGTSI